MNQFSSVPLLSRVRLFATPWIAACQGFPVHHQLPELAQTHVHLVCDAILTGDCLTAIASPVVLKLWQSVRRQG